MRSHAVAGVSDQHRRTSCFCSASGIYLRATVLDRGRRVRFCPIPGPFVVGAASARAGGVLARDGRYVRLFLAEVVEERVEPRLELGARVRRGRRRRRAGQSRDEAVELVEERVVGRVVRRRLDRDLGKEFGERLEEHLVLVLRVFVVDDAEFRVARAEDAHRLGRVRVELVERAPELRKTAAERLVPAGGRREPRGGPAATCAGARVPGPGRGAAATGPRTIRARPRDVSFMNAAGPKNGSGVKTPRRRMMAAIIESAQSAFAPKATTKQTTSSTNATWKPESW